MRPASSRKKASWGSTIQRRVWRNSALAPGAALPLPSPRPRNTARAIGGKSSSSWLINSRGGPAGWKTTWWPVRAAWKEKEIQPWRAFQIHSGADTTNQASSTSRVSPGRQRRLRSDWASRIASSDTSIRKLWYLQRVRAPRIVPSPRAPATPMGRLRGWRASHHTSRAAISSRGASGSSSRPPHTMSNGERLAIPAVSSAARIPNSGRQASASSPVASV